MYMYICVDVVIIQMSLKIFVPLEKVNCNESFKYELIWIV